METYAGKPVSVFVRDAEDIKRILDANPFSDREGKYIVTIFLNEKPADDALVHATGLNGEEMCLGVREI